jgi:hypothetical protein
VAAAFLAAAPAVAQTLKFSTPSARAERVDVDLSLQTPAGKEPSTLQWEAILPIGQATLVDGFPQTGAAAQAAGKIVSCSAKTREADSLTILCLAFGGAKPLGNGVVARFSFRISPTARKGPAVVRLKRAIAVTADLKRTDIPDTSVAIPIPKR